MSAPTQSLLFEARIGRILLKRFDGISRAFTNPGTVAGNLGLRGNLPYRMSEIRGKALLRHEAEPHGAEMLEGSELGAGLLINDSLPKD